MPRNLLTLLIGTILVTAVTPNFARGQLPSNSQPVWLADERVLIGQYRFEEGGIDGMKIAVDLNADRTASYLITTGAADTDFIKAVGYWTVQGDVIHIHNKPGPVRLAPAGAPIRDPEVGLSVIALNVDGSPAEGLGLTWEGAQGLYAMSDGRHVSGKGQRIEASQLTILRVADRKVLQTIDLNRGGVNSFRFTYHPSNEEPFDITAITLDENAQVIEVEVGTAQAKLTRIGTRR